MQTFQGDRAADFPGSWCEEAAVAGQVKQDCFLFLADTFQIQLCFDAACGLDTRFHPFRDAFFLEESRWNGIRRKFDSGF